MILRKSFFTLFLIFFVLLLGPARSQSQVSSGSNDNELWVVASAGENNMRITALGFTQRIRLEVIAQNGERIYDSDSQNGNTVE
jgi:hypothetical protein